MPEPLRVSVVLPVRDDAQALRRCLVALSTLSDAPGAKAAAIRKTAARARLKIR